MVDLSTDYFGICSLNGRIVGMSTLVWKDSRFVAVGMVGM